MVEAVPRVPASKELVRQLAAFNGLRFDEDRLAELAATMESFQQTLTAFQPELDWVEPMAIQYLRKD